MLGTVTLLTLAAAMPVKEAAAQDPLGGAIGCGVGQKFLA
jgi:hypothetical protein